MAKFPFNNIISLLDENLEFNLGESTSQDLLLSEILTPQVLTRLAKTRLSYGSSQGNGELRGEIAKHLKIEPQNVLLTNGAAAAIFLAIFILCKTGDEVVTVKPNFPPTLDIIEAVGARRRIVRLSFDEGYRLTSQALKNSLSDKTKLVILVSPHNPSGVSVPPDEIEEIISTVSDVCPEAWILIDETYREATYGDEPASATSANLRGRVMTAASFSKCHGAPGLRVGWLTCRSEELMQQLTLAKLNTVISCSVVDELLALEVFRRRDLILKNRRQILFETLNLTEQWVANNGQFVEWVRPNAGALCCVRLRPEIFSNLARVAEFYHQARLRQVQLAPGEWFGETEKIFRLGFGYLPPHRFEQALNALSLAMRQAL